MISGTVKFFDAKKGFGFIAKDEGGPDVFVHVSALERSGLRGLADGQSVTFEIDLDNRSGRTSASNIRTA
jgi:cold shock protein